MLFLEDGAESVSKELEERAPEDKGCGGWGGAGSAVQGPQGTTVSAWGPTVSLSLRGET